MAITFNKNKKDQPIGYNLVDNSLSDVIKKVTNGAPITANRDKFDFLTKLKTLGLNKEDATKYIINLLNIAHDKKDLSGIKEYLGMLDLDKSQIDNIVSYFHLQPPEQKPSDEQEQNQNKPGGP